MIRLFVGTDPQQSKAEAALEASVRANTGKPVEITWMRQGDPGWNWGGRESGWATPFSLFRWTLPHYCNYEGRAIYMDVDQLALGDLTDLWEWPIPKGKCVAWTTPPDVMVWACDQVEEWQPSYSDKRQFVRRYRRLSVPLPECWNSRDEVKPDTKVLHFTSLRTQPWKPYPELYDYDVAHKDPKAVSLFWEYAGQ